MKKGMIQVYTGDGKGKTTAAIGQMIRAYGRGYKTGLIQFFKGFPSGELMVLEALDIPYFQFGTGKFVAAEPTTEDIQCAASGIKKIRDLWESLDLLVLDEISYLLNFQMLPIREMVSFLNGKPSNLELILTGREMPGEIIKLAHLVTNMKKIKHPYEMGIRAREGIEY